MIRRAYRQKATYWGAPRSNGTGGFTFSKPKTLNVRWENKSEQFSGPNGEIAVSDAMVWLKERVDIGGYLALGQFSGDDPTKIKGAYVVRNIAEIPDLRNVTSEIRAFL